jgi:hypothetical protein
MESKDFILEEYKSKWTYIEHSENVFEKKINWFFVVTAAILTFLFKDMYSFQSIVFDFKSNSLLLFLIIYQFSSILSVIYHKKNYNHYIERISEIEKKFCDYKVRPNNGKYFSTYKTRYYSLIIVFGGAVFLFFYSLQINTIFSLIWAVLTILINIFLMINIIKVKKN